MAVEARPFSRSADSSFSSMESMHFAGFGLLNVMNIP
jgi:hypothetical protein